MSAHLWACSKIADGANGQQPFVRHIVHKYMNIHTLKASIKLSALKTATALALVFFTSGAFAQQPSEAAAPVTISAKIDSTTLTMGDRTNIRVEVLKNGHYGLMMDQVQQDDQGVYTLNKVEVRETSVDSTDIGNGRIQVIYTYLIQPFEPGTQSIGPFRFVNGADTIDSEIVTLKVLEPDMPKVMKDSLLINPFEGTVSIPGRWYDFIPEWWYWPLLALLIIALGAVIFFLYKKNGPTLLPHKKVIPPYELAVKRLSSLKARHLAESGHDKEYYTELTDILRQYIDGRFGVNAREMTTTQILEAMSAEDTLKHFIDALGPVLRTADFVKFACQRPDISENIRSFNAVNDFVSTTRPLPEVDENAKGKQAADAKGKQDVNDSESPKTTNTKRKS